MKKFLHKIKFKEIPRISELSVWTMLCGLSCVAAIIIAAQNSFEDSIHFYNAMMKLSIRMVAISIMVSAVVDLLVNKLEKD